MTIKPYIIVPNLIEQPTWGGNYIVQFKKISDPYLKNIKVGQAYELYEFTTLTTVDSTLASHFPLELGNSKDPNITIQRNENNYETFSINDLIALDPKKVLGTEYVKKFGPTMKVLIKFTQAKGNSYQIHVRQKTGSWLPKPESWYYFEPGLITLGVKKGIDWDTYKAVCVSINELAHEMSRQVTAGILSHQDAQNQLAGFIAKHNPERFVNIVETHKDQAIDLSSCGIHHSWEEDNQRFPLGIVLYEVQENVFDDISTIRNFDKGKIKEDGSIRQLHIDDYFTYIDRSDEANNPENHTVHTKVVRQDTTSIVKQIFLTPRYSMQEVALFERYNDSTGGTFHHLFVKSGDVQVITTDTTLTVSQGYSVFMPASTGSYSVKPLASDSVMLKTYV